jgi:GntR family transcriptional regulator
MDYFTIDVTLSTPLYLQIAQSIKNAIHNGVLRYGDLLPTEKELCNAFYCSRIVAKMAYDLLAHEHYVDRIQGKGTYVSNRPKWTINIEKILQIDVQGHIDSHPITRKKTYHNISNDFTRVSATLELDINEKMVHYQRVFYVGVNPILLQSCYVPESLCHNHSFPLSDDQSFFSWLEASCHTVIDSVKNRVGVVGLESWESHMLNVTKDSAAHICRAIIIGQQQKPIAYVEMRLPYTSFRLEITNDE